MSENRLNNELEFCGWFSTFSPGVNHFVPNTTGSDLLANRSNFYNGNISMMITSIKDPTSGSVLPQGYAYQYDQLNRLAQMRAFSNYNLSNNEFLYSGGSAPTPYGENFTYDANGNILTLDRSGVAANPNMDALTYQYDYYNNNPAEGLRSNRLYHVNDGTSSTGYDDIQDQGPFTIENQSTTTKEVNTLNNYGYDELGNLVRDDQEEIATITWTVSGKIKSVIRTGGSTLSNLEFVYDPMGNRIAKIETPNPYDPNGVKTTYYGRDAQGNHLVTYDQHINSITGNEHILVDERIIYGSKRLGLQDFNDSIWGPEYDIPVLNYYDRNLGRKKYEGTNHLGNVLAVFSDKRIPKDDISPGGPIDYYEADIHGAYDYYSFGSPMPERTFVPQACSTQMVTSSVYTYQDDFNPGIMWLPMGSALINPGPGSMDVLCNAPADGAQQTLPCIAGIPNVLDLTISYGQNDIQIMLLDPLTMLPLPGYPILFPAMPPGTVQNIQLFFVGPPSGNVIVQINSPGGPFPFPDMFSIQYAAISTQTTVPTQVCWDEDYRFGFMSYEKDDEIKGGGNSYDMGARLYDPRIGRTPIPDKFKDKYPGISPYAFALNNPIFFVDIDGNVIVDKNGNVVTIDRDSDGNITGITATNKKGKVIAPDPFTVDMITQVNKTDIGRETLNQMDVHKDQFQYREDKTGAETGGGPAQSNTSEEKGIVTHKMYINTGYETDGTRFEGASPEEFKNATGVHEPKHFLNPAQVILDQTQTNAENDPDSEFNKSGQSAKFQYENFETEVLKDELKTREQFNSGALDSKPYGKDGGTAREKYKEVINAPKSSDVKKYKPN